MAKKKMVTTFLDDKDARQAEIYAKDLHELYRAERQKRKELAEERLVLTYKLNELEALNKLFQSHLEQRIEIERLYKGLIEEIKKLLASPTPEELADGLKKLLIYIEAGIAETSALQEKEEYK